MAETTGGAARLVAIRDEPLSVDEVLAAVEDVAAGGTVVFLGTVRDNDEGKAVASLGYTAHPTALAMLQSVVDGVTSRWPTVAVAAVHRTGPLKIGDIAVIVAAACPHRGEAFDAARALIDELKATVPIWKEQHFSDGTQEWVGLP